MRQNRFLWLAGGLAGFFNGIFGGGGGMLLLPLLSRHSRLAQRQLFATCVAVILPICGVSALISLLHEPLSLGEALPYLAGGLLGGAIGGLTFRKVPVTWLKGIFALFLLYGGVRYLT